MPYLPTSYSSRQEADLTAQVLRDEGIEAWVSAGDAGGLVPSMQSIAGVRIEVSNDDFDRAASISAEMTPAKTAPREPLSARERIQGWGIGIVIVVAVGWVIFNYARSLSEGTLKERAATPPQHEMPF
jgi:hypothetical protein